MPKLDMMSLIRLIKRDHGTQAAFCDSFSISRSTMHKWKLKNGEINEQLMRALIAHFKCTRIELDESARHIDEQILSECAAKVQRICDEVGVDFVDVEDRIYWICSLYRRRANQHADDDGGLRKALTTNVVKIGKSGEQ